MQRHRPVPRSAEHAAVAHRDDQERTVRQPAQARRLRLDAEDLLGGTEGIDGEHDMPEEVGEPPASFVPTRAFEEGAAVEQPLHVADGGRIGAWTSSTEPPMPGAHRDRRSWSSTRSATSSTSTNWARAASAHVE